MGIPDTRAKLPMAIDWPLAAATLALASIGVFNLTSAGPTPMFWHRQFLSLVLSIVTLAAISGIDYRILMRVAYPFYAITLILLAITVVKGTMVMGHGSWIRWGWFSMQPSEFAKLAAILAMARYFHDQRVGGPYGIKELAVPVLIAIVPIGLIMLQPDLGTTAMFTFILGSMILFAGVRKRLLIGAVVSGLAFTPIAWKLLAPHQKNRIWAFLNPQSDPMGIGYNAIQSMVAIGSGKILGKGYRLGTQTALKYLPERHSDFAFSVLGEEWGFFGAMIVLLLFLFIVIWGLRISSQSRDRFGCLAGIGITAIIFWHSSVNVAMTLGAFPVVGIPLPFLSYGGSFLITISAGIAILMSINNRRLMF